MRWVRAMALSAGVALIVGCSGTGTAQPAPSTAHTSVAVDGPWRAWTKSLSRSEASGFCGATAHQVVCSTAPDGLVGVSRATGAITWTVATGRGGKNGGLVVDAADERAATSGGHTLRAANLRTGKEAWTHRLPSTRSYVDLSAADGVVYALDAKSDAVQTEGYTNVALGAFRASDGATLWHRTTDATWYEGMTAFGGRVYSTDGTKVTARDARTGRSVATSPSGTECPHLISGGGYLVCTGSPSSAGDVFPPLRRLDPATLAPLRTAEDTGMKPERGVISPDGVLVLFEDSAEDPGAGTWNAYDLNHTRRLWGYDTTTEEAELSGGRFVTFTPGNDDTRGRVISIDLHAGPAGTGAAAPRLSPPYSQSRDGEHPALIAPGGRSGHVVVEPRTHHALRSIPLP
ncbi:PQQ-binding-like beta-propeller repeat protein [Streptomyces sp. NPDC087903]|uniref:outer membrane protein assembly factor BamB family protein n=1 Tax=Streptomyces sp. NPDC087903 TaxID=3365819 RepID=UPI00382D7694